MKRALCPATAAAAMLATVGVAYAAEMTIDIDTPMAPPTWAVLECELLRANADACEEFYDKYFDERGYLQCVERWGGDDGPDDAIENVADWPILHALGGRDSILRLYKQAWEGHLRQYTEAKTAHVPFARDGMYYKEFPVMFDWMHNGEGLRVFNLQGLSDPEGHAFGRRVRRFAGFYMNEDPQARNYDPQHRIIRSMFNGSRGPLLRKATGLDWAGDPIEVKGRFQLGHGERNYEEIVAHFKDYNDIIGDHPQNLSATTLAANAFMLTGEQKYRDWLLEYVDAWFERTHTNGGIIPSNIGPDGTIGGGTDGKWYGGVYGWGFTVVVPQSGALANRNQVQRGLIGFGNALLLTGDQKYVDVWTRMIDLINQQRQTIEGKTMYPRMYGDEGWYGWEQTPWSFGALECWFWSCSADDLDRVPRQAWVEFLQGRDPDYPVRALTSDFETIRGRVQGMRNDPTTPDTRLSDDPMRFNPATVGTLRQLMMAGLDPGRGAAPLHSRLRYFDPVRRRAGLPQDVAALIDRISDSEVRVTLVNISQTTAREVIVQAGAYGEHQCLEVRSDPPSRSGAAAEAARIAVNDRSFRARIAAGSGARMVITMRRYTNDPTLSFPWSR